MFSPSTLSDPTTLQVNKATSQRVKACIHCKDNCSVQDLITEDELHFCCHGCQAVYHLINDNGLCAYYDLAALEDRGVLKAGPITSTTCQIFDDEGVSKRLGLVVRGDLAVISLRCPDISCASCLYLLNNLSKFNGGITRAKASFLDKIVTIWFDPTQVKLSQVAGLMAKLGYPPAHDLPMDVAKNTNRKQSAALLKRLGVAGFCAGNTMMLSFPNYLGLQEATVSQFQALFIALNVFLGTMIVAYSAGPYFVKSLRSLRFGQLSVDVPIALAVSTLYIRSLADVFGGLGTGYFDSLAGLVFFLLVGQWVQSRYFESLTFDYQFRQFLPLTCLRLKDEDDVGTQVLLDELNMGDMILVKMGETIAADMEIISQQSVLLDTAYITGEADLQSVNVGDEVLAGTKVATGTLTARITEVPATSYLAKLWDQADQQMGAKQMASPFENGFVKYFTLFMLSVASTTALFWWFTDPSVALNAVTAVLMVACPCALTLALPFASGQGVTELAKHGFYLKNGQVFERLAQLNHIVFDKTGTLITDDDLHQVTWQNPIGYPELVPNHLINLIHLASSVNQHPLLQVLAKHLTQPQDLPNADIQLNQLLSVAGHGVVLDTSVGNFRLGSFKHCMAPSYTRADGSVVGITHNGRFEGYFSISQQLATSTTDALKVLINNYQLTVSTGDTAEGAASMMKLGNDLKHLKLMVSQQPADKLAYLSQLADQNQQVMMVGDGLNDGPAMKAASVALALVKEQNQFNPSADIIAQQTKLVMLPQCLAFARATLRVVWICLGLSVVYNIAGLGMAVSGYLSPMIAAFFMPISSLSVVALAVVLTKWQASKYLSPANSANSSTTAKSV